MKKLLSLLVAVVAMVGVTGTGGALATQGAAKADRTERAFARMDTDKSGAIERAEAVASADKRFARKDANKDGVLSREEHLAMKSKPGKTVDAARTAKRKLWREKMFVKLSAGNAQGITRDAYIAHTLAPFVTADANKDSKVTRDEAMAAKKKTASKKRKG